MQYAVQLKANGQLVGLFDSLESAKKMVGSVKAELEIIDTTNSCKIVVRYVELGGPNGYGCDCPEFTTYGSLIRAITNLYKWIKESSRTFGPDYREVQAYFRHCYLSVDGVDKTDWLLKQADKMKKMIIV